VGEWVGGWVGGWVGVSYPSLQGWWLTWNKVLCVRVCVELYKCVCEGGGARMYVMFW